jgi:hypothetical protein
MEKHHKIYLGENASRIDIHCTVMYNVKTLSFYMHCQVTLFIMYSALAPTYVHIYSVSCTLCCLHCHIHRLSDTYTVLRTVVYTVVYTVKFNIIYTAARAKLLSTWRQQELISCMYCTFGSCLSIKKFTPYVALSYGCNTRVQCIYVWIPYFL